MERLRKLHEGNRKSILSFNKTNNDNLKDNSSGTSEAFLGKEFHGQDCGSQMVLVDKVLIFSQFLEHIHVIEQQVWNYYVFVRSVFVFHSWFEF